MTSMVCKIKLRKGEPLGLSACPAPTFLSLPHEIQNEIYKLLLTATEPVSVWHEQPVEEWHERPSSFYSQRAWRYSSRSPGPVIIRTLTTALLTTNKQISFHAAAVFYASNTFTFIGSQCWDPLYAFLSSIGATNRSHLRRLEFGASEPEKLILHPDGTVTTAPRSFWDRKVLARDNYPRNYSHNPDRRGEIEIEHLPPSIEASFRLLGSRQFAAPLQLMLVAYNEYTPGAWISDEMGKKRCSMELPDHVERMKEEYLVGEANDKSVEIKWKVRVWDKTDFEDYKASFVEAGWEFLEIIDKGNCRGMMFIMQRKKIVRG